MAYVIPHALQDIVPSAPFVGQIRVSPPMEEEQELSQFVDQACKMTPASATSHAAALKVKDQYVGSYVHQTMSIVVELLAPTLKTTVICTPRTLLWPQ